MREMALVPYDPHWPRLYEEEKARLAGVFGKLILDIQHFGSTSIPGMSAKPIIDIMIIVADTGAIDAFNPAMEKLGYTPRGENGEPGRRYFQKPHPDGSGNHTHHVHIYPQGHRHAIDELLFRDYLKIDRAAFQEYEDVKKAAALKYRYSPPAYTDAKTACVLRLMAQARAYYAGQ